MGEASKKLMSAKSGEKFIENPPEEERGRGFHAQKANARTTWAAQAEKKGDMAEAAKERALAAAHYEKAAEYAEKSGHASAATHKKAAERNRAAADKHAGGDASGYHAAAKAEVSGQGALPKLESEGLRVSAKGLNAEQRKTVEYGLRAHLERMHNVGGGIGDDERAAAKTLRDAGREAEAKHFDKLAESAKAAHEKRRLADRAKAGEHSEASKKVSGLKAFAEQAKAQHKALQRGKKGGQFYMSEHGQKVYVGKK